MKLNSDIIYFHLSKQHSVLYIPGEGQNPELGGLCIIPALPASPAIFFFWAPQPSPLPETFLCFSDNPPQPSGGAH